MHPLTITIAGGGFLGLFTALALKRENPEIDVAIFEQNAFLGEGNSSRNSGVLHSGIYYETDSLKHQMCLQGNVLWKNYADDLNIPIKHCGKYITTPDTSEASKEKLNQLLKNGQVNKVESIRKITKSEQEKLSEVIKVTDGIFCPTTAVVNTSAALKILEDELYKLNCPVLLNSKVEELNAVDSKISFSVNGESFVTDIFLNCAGLGGVGLRSQLGLTNYENYLVKGHYLKTSKFSYTDCLIYPLPDENLKDLGIHLNFDFDNAVRFGPNAIDVESFDFKMEEKTIDAMYPHIKSQFFTVQKEDLTLDYCGIRPKIRKVFADGTKELMKDFVVTTPSETKVEGLYELLGIESPGLTSAPAFAQMLVKIFVKHLEENPTRS